MKLNWRKWNNILHRDLGYFFFGLTIIYAVSGIAANHLRQWDSNFKVERKEVRLQNVSRETSSSRESIEKILEQAGVPGTYKSHFRSSPAKLQVFLTRGNLDVDMDSGVAVLEFKQNRPLLRHFNFLHLNHGQKWWTWIADFYALGLFILAVTGLLVLKGKQGFLGRGKWFVALGILLPIVFLLLYFQ